MSNLFNSYNVSSKAQRSYCNFFDYEKWQAKYDPNYVPPEDAQSPLKPKQSLLLRSSFTDNNTNRMQANNLMSKSESTAHIPSMHRAKYSKRIFGCFDKDTAERMFGYRVQYKGPQTTSAQVGSQRHKPVHKFAAEIVEDLSKSYEPIHNYFTSQKIIIPIQLSSSCSDYSCEAENNDDQQKLERVQALGVLQKSGDKLYKRKCVKLRWHHRPQSPNF